MSNEHKYQDVQVLLAEPRTHIRGTLKIALNHAGLEKVEHTGNYEKVVDSLERSANLDILICDMDLENGEICNVISRLRQNKFGINPFLCILGFTWRPEAQDVVRMVNSGVDHLITAPVSPAQILIRIKSMVRNRVPFVVTSDYIGPDRRHNTRRSNDFPTMEAPNSLRDKALDSWDAIEFSHQLDGAVGMINASKISRQAEKIAFIADAISTMSNDRKSALVIQPFIERLGHLVEDMENRVEKRGYQHISELCRACVGVVDEMKSTESLPSEQDIDLLKHLGMAIKGALEPFESSKTIAREISETVVAR
jgi:CheY-like chemotaxis protein